MVRKLAAISLAISFIAMSTSGLMMFFIEKPSFTIQMHPVHKLFGLIMIVSVVGHLSFNYKALLNHLKQQSVKVFGGVMVVVLVLLYGIALNNGTDPELARIMDEAAAKAEGH